MDTTLLLCDRVERWAGECLYLWYSSAAFSFASNRKMTLCCRVGIRKFTRLSDSTVLYVSNIKGLCGGWGGGGVLKRPLIIAVLNTGSALPAFIRRPGPVRRGPLGSFLC